MFPQVYHLVGKTITALGGLTLAVAGATVASIFLANRSSSTITLSLPLSPLLGLVVPFATAVVRKRNGFGVQPRVRFPILVLEGPALRPRGQRSEGTMITRMRVPLTESFGRRGLSEYGRWFGSGRW